MSVENVTHRLELEESEVQETFFANGWTDGLPVVPPTPERVDAFLEVVGADDPTVLIGFMPARERGVTLEKAAVNAVMAGCLPEYFPVVVAALEAMFDAAFNAHTVLSSTGGAALGLVVSGPIASEIGMNARYNCFGPGNRANGAAPRCGERSSTPGPPRGARRANPAGDDEHPPARDRAWAAPHEGVTVS